MVKILDRIKSQYDKLLKDLQAHVNNLPLADQLSGFLPEFTKTIDDFIDLMVQQPDLYQRFAQNDLSQKINPLIKNIAIYLFLKNKFQMNCVSFNNKKTYININNVYLQCEYEDNYYQNRFLNNTPVAINFVFSAIQEFLNYYTRANFLDVGKVQNINITVENREFEIIYRTNFFVEGGRVILYNTDDQNLLEAVSRLDFTGILDKVFQNPIISGKNFYDLFLFSAVAQQFLISVLQDCQTGVPLFQDCLAGNTIDVAKALRFLASVTSSDIPTLFKLHELVNEPPGDDFQDFQKNIIANMKDKLLNLVPSNLFKTNQASLIFTDDNWNDNWGGLTLMDLFSFPASIVGPALIPNTQLYLNNLTNESYSISTALVYKLVATKPVNQYEPRLVFSITSYRSRPLPIPKTLEAQLPKHLVTFLTQDLRLCLNKWISQMNDWSNIGNQATLPLNNFLNQIKVAQFLTDDLATNYSRRLGYYFWRLLRTLEVVQNKDIKYVIQNTLKKKLYLVDADMT